MRARLRCLLKRLTRERPCAATARVLAVFSPAVFLLLFVAVPAIAQNATAADDPTTENITMLKVGIVNTLATWIPFVLLFTLIGYALGAIGFGNIFRDRK